MDAARVNQRRVLAAVPTAALVAGLLAGCMGGGPSPVDPSSSPDASASEAAARPSPDFAKEITEFTYSGQKGKTTIELLQANDPDAVVEGKGEDTRVVAIRGRAADDGKGQSWTLFVDGKKKEPVAVETKDGQAIAWRLTSD